jgi:hypothetical protein
MSILATDKRGWVAIELPFPSAITAFISEPKSVFSNYFDSPALKTKGRQTSQWRAFGCWRLAVCFAGSRQAERAKSSGYKDFDFWWDRDTEEHTGKDVSPADGPRLRGILRAQR